MPMGHHLAHCFCCGIDFIVGDCIPSVCIDCHAKGYRGMGCEKCRRELDERMLRNRLEYERIVDEAFYEWMAKRPHDADFGTGIELAEAKP